MKSALSEQQHLIHNIFEDGMECLMKVDDWKRVKDNCVNQ